MTPDAPARPAALRMQRTHQQLAEDTRRSVVTVLNQRLADATDLFSQTKHAHWNVKGPQFYQLHKLFDEIAEQVERQADTLAERATALGGVANGTIRMAAAGSGLPEMPAGAQTGEEFLRELVERFGRHSQRLYEAVDRAEEAGDHGSVDILGEMAQQVDKQLYLLESHLQTPQGAR